MNNPNPIASNRVSWRDSNMALVGSDLDHKIKQAAAASEPQWTGVGETVQLRVWRIEHFIVKPWSRSKYGKFHTGDSYVILNTFKPYPTKPKLAHDIHIWIGDESTQDEFGTAAYKMVELDEKLGLIAAQHREVQEHESDKFLKYFGNKIAYLSGGAATGFRLVEPTQSEPHLYRIKGIKEAIKLKQLPVRRDQMNAGDVFVLVADEDHVWLWVGSEANRYEKNKGLGVARAFCKKGNVVVLDQGVNDGEDQDLEFWNYMPSTVSTLGVFKRAVKVQKADGNDDKVKAFVPLLFRLPGSSGGSVTEVATAKMVSSGPTDNATSPRIPRTELHSQHGYLLDTGFHVYLWLGKNVRRHTKIYAIPQSSEYFRIYKRPLLPVTLVKEGTNLKAFENHFYDPEESTFCDTCACSVM